MLILASYLATRYAGEQPLSLSASLVFEQSYGGVDGDSASSTELYALLSALAQIPIRQSLAITGSVDQLGHVQAIGGVNEKIEGFFDVCAARGLTGDQGVLIPAANIKHLMLRKDVVEACRAGRFRIYAVETIDQGIEILTGVAAGEANAAGEFPIGTVNRAVAARLAGFSRKAQKFAAEAKQRERRLSKDLEKEQAVVIDKPAGADMARRRFRRVVLALDTASADLSAMERAAALAERLQGELIALFVADIDLVRLAEHRQIFSFSTLLPAGRQLAAENFKEALRLQAAHLRRAVEAAAARRQVKYAFQVRQGRLLAEVLSAAHDDDLVVISWAGNDRGAPWTGSTPPPPAAVAQALAEARAPSVLLLHPKTAASGPVLVAFDGSEAARNGLALAAQVADLDGAMIEVALLAGRVDEAEAWGAEIVEALAESRLTVTLLHMPKAGLQILTDIAARRLSGLLVLGAERALAEGEAGRRLLQRVPCSLLLVR